MDSRRVTPKCRTVANIQSNGNYLQMRGIVSLICRFCSHACVSDAFLSMLICAIVSVLMDFAHYPFALLVYDPNASLTLAPAWSARLPYEDRFDLTRIDFHVI